MSGGRVLHFGPTFEPKHHGHLPGRFYCDSSFLMALFLSAEGSEFRQAAMRTLRYIARYADKAVILSSVLAYEEVLWVLFKAPMSEHQTDWPTLWSAHCDECLRICALYESFLSDVADLKVGLVDSSDGIGEAAVKNVRTFRFQPMDGFHLALATAAGAGLITADRGFLSSQTPSTDIMFVWKHSIGTQS